MAKKDKKVLYKAEQIINKYHDDDSIYYHELVKSFKEYKELVNMDKTTNDLYIKHINKLCEFIVERKHSNVILAVMCLIFIFMLSLTGYTTYKYYDITKNLEDNIVKANSTTNLVVTYKDLENYTAMTIANDQNYGNLKPLIVNLKTTSNKLKEYKIRYNIYIVEQNDNISENLLLNRDVFLYNILKNDYNSGIKQLKKAMIKNDRIQLYSGILESGKEDTVEIRMWLDKNTKLEYENKLYKFKLYVDGVVI